MSPLQNDWAAYQFDHAVLFTGLTIENALHEREQVGSGKHVEYRPKYTLSQLLDPRFRLPAPKGMGGRGVFAEFVEQLKQLAAQPHSRGRVWRYVGPEPEGAH